jgi:hypothetical protein
MHVDVYNCIRSESESELDNKMSGILRKTNKHAYLCVHVCICAYGARAYRTRHHRSSRMTVSVCLPVHTVTQKHTHTHTSNTKKTGKYLSSNDRKSTLSLKHSISVLSHEKLAYSRKR